MKNSILGKQEEKERNMLHDDVLFISSFILGGRLSASSPEASYDNVRLPTLLLHDTTQRTPETNTCLWKTMRNAVPCALLVLSLSAASVDVNAYRHGRDS